MTSVRNHIAQVIAENCFESRVMDANGKPFWKKPQWQSAERAADALLAGKLGISEDVSVSAIENIVVDGQEYIPLNDVKQQLDDAKRHVRHWKDYSGKLASQISILESSRLDLVRLGARAMRQSAEADCGNYSESCMEDCMTSAGLSRQDKVKLNAQVDAADHIRKDIHETCEDSALGYGSYILSESDRIALKSLGVTSDWLYRSEKREA